MLDELLSDARERMLKSVGSTRDQFGSVRTGRATPAILDRVSVNYYGATTPLKQLATITAPEARLLTVQPFDKSSIKMIEKAITEADLRPHPRQRREHDPAFGPRAHRGAPPGSSQGRPHDRRRTAGSRSATSVARSCTTCASSKVRGRWAPTTNTVPRAELQKVTDAYVADLDELLKHKEDDILEV